MVQYLQFRILRFPMNNIEYVLNVGEVTPWRFEKWWKVAGLFDDISGSWTAGAQRYTLNTLNTHLFRGTFAFCETCLCCTVFFFRLTIFKTIRLHLVCSRQVERGCLDKIASATVVSVGEAYQDEEAWHGHHWLSEAENKRLRQRKVYSMKLLVGF